MSETINRYDRQELISGWDQKKINNYKVAVVGTGHISNFLTASLAALGIGDTRIYDDTRSDFQKTDTPYNKREFLLSNLAEGKSRVEFLEKKLSKINPLVNLYGLHMELDKVTECLVEKPAIMISTTNNLDSAKKYFDFARKNKIDFYACASDYNSAIFSKQIQEITRFDGKEQEGVISEAISGILAGEILQKIFGRPTLDSFSYSPAGKRFGLEEQVDIKYGDLAKKTALVVGAGALGNFLGLGLSHAGVGNIHLVDDDTIETTNLNRQILFYDFVGEYKADSLAKRLIEINPTLKVYPLRERVSESFEQKIKKIKPDVLIDCVDNLSTRAILNHFALRYGIPLISGGTDPNAGQVVVYEPDKSSCLNCRLGVDKALITARASHSCIHAPTPSVVVTNHIIGGLMAAETRCVLDSQNYGAAAKKTIKYDSTKSLKAGLIGSENPCTCKRRISADKWIQKLVPTEKPKNVNNE